MKKILCFVTVHDFHLYVSRATEGKTYYIKEIKEFVKVGKHTYEDGLVHTSISYREDMPANYQAMLTAPLYHDTLGEHEQPKWYWERLDKLKVGK